MKDVKLSACSGMLQSNCGSLLLWQLLMCDSVLHVRCNSTPFCSVRFCRPHVFSPLHTHSPLFVNACTVQEKEKETEKERELARQRPFLSKSGTALSLPKPTLIVKNVKWKVKWKWNPHSALHTVKWSTCAFSDIKPLSGFSPETDCGPNSAAWFPHSFAGVVFSDTSLPPGAESNLPRPPVICLPLCRAVLPGVVSNPKLWSEPQREEKPPTATASCLYEEP